jgi:hypothetical protein
MTTFFQAWRRRQASRQAAEWAGFRTQQDAGAADLVALRRPREVRGLGPRTFPAKRRSSTRAKAQLSSG